MVPLSTFLITKLLSQAHNCDSLQPLDVSFPDYHFYPNEPVPFMELSANDLVTMVLVHAMYNAVFTPGIP